VTSSPVSDRKVKSGAGSPSRTTAASVRRAVGIVRVSRLAGEDAVSPAEQRQRIEATCEGEKLRLLQTLEELDVSGGAALDLRPGLSRAVAMIEAGEADVIVVAYFDRLFRSLAVQQEVLGRVEAAGGRIVATDMGEVRADSASGWLSSTTLGMVAEYHRHVTAERTNDAKRRAVADGIAPFPNLPFYLRRDDDRRIEHDPRKVRVMREAVAQRLAGGTIDSIRRYLRRRDVRLSYHGVQSLFSNRLLLGELHFGAMVNESAFPPVIDAETWQRLQRVALPRGRRARSELLLARLGVLRCGTCGSRMVVGTSQGQYALYRCPPVGDCPRRVTVSAEIAERTVAEAVQELLAGIEGRASVEGGALEAAQELVRRQEALDKAIRVFAGLEDERSARDRLQELRKARDEARECHDELVAASVPAVTVGAGDWDRLTLDERRALIRAVIARVVVSPGRGADRLRIEPRSE
jgi:DNA invertase Pin-like site-specific DNA recombinase